MLRAAHASFGPVIRRKEQLALFLASVQQSLQDRAVLLIPQEKRVRGASEIAEVNLAKYGRVKPVWRADIVDERHAGIELVLPERQMQDGIFHGRARPTSILLEPLLRFGQWIGGANLDIRPGVAPSSGGTITRQRYVAREPKSFPSLDKSDASLSKLAHC